MGAPEYLTTKDTAAENALIGRIHRAWWQWKLTRLPPHCPVDCMAYDEDGNITALIELKCRKVRSDKYTSLMVNAHKVLALVHWAQAIDLPAYVVAAYTDGDRYARLDDRERFDLQMGRRHGEAYKPLAYIDGLRPL